MMNEYKVFYKNNNMFWIINRLIIILIILSLFSLVLLIDNQIIFNVIVAVAFSLFIINCLLENKNEIFKERNKAFLNKPLVFDKENNMYLLLDKSSIVLPGMMIFVFFIAFLIQSNGSKSYFFILLSLLIVFEISIILKKLNLNYLIKNNNNQYNMINNPNSKYKVLKINKIIKNIDNSYIMEFSNNTSKQLYISKKYNNYDELIQLIDYKIVSNNQ